MCTTLNTLFTLKLVHFSTLSYSLTRTVTTARCAPLFPVTDSEAKLFTMSEEATELPDLTREFTLVFVGRRAGPPFRS